MSPRISRSGRLYAALRLARSRAVIARKRLSGVDTTASVHPTARVAKDLRAGAYVFIGHDCEVGPDVEIGRYTMLAPEVRVIGLDHNFEEPGRPVQFAGRPAQQPTRIGDDVWLGQGATLMRGLTVGRGAVVAAGAVVTRDVPPYEVWAGVPARKLRDRFEDSAARAVHDRMLDGPLVAPTFVEPQGG